MSKPIPAVPRFEPDDRQREAIDHLLGPLLVIAGAGTGKTTVLTRRIAQLVREGRARPDEILALTYTDNAAAEMRERMRAELGNKAKDLQVATFHAYCNNLLIRNGKQLGVLEDYDLWIFLRKRLRELNLKHFIIPANVGKFLHDLLDFMRRCQDELVGPEKYAQYVQQVERGELPIPRVAKSKEALALTDEEVLGRCREISRVFTQVEGMLREKNLGTFGHMITRAHELLCADPALLAREREHARFILVDEFQDANFAQVKILQNLAGDDQNVFAVGDPDQAIYRFRGASSAAFSLFQHNFPGVRIVALEKNRRSTSPILKTAHALISRNPDFPSSGPGGARFQRAPLTSGREEDAARAGKALPSLPVEVVVLGPKDRDLECSDVATLLRLRRRESRCDWKDLAVLYRQHLHRDELVAELAEQNIPFSIENMDVMDTSEARDLFACMGAVVSVRDDASLFRVAALPQFTVDPERLRAGLRALPRDQEAGGVATVLEQIPGGRAVLNALQQTRDEIAKTKAKSRAAVETIIPRFELDRTSPAVSAILEFIRKWEEKPMTGTGQISELLEYLDYFREAGGTIPMSSPEVDAVRLMTAHVAKGLEFDHVAILRANSGSFPASYKESLVEFPRELRDPESVVPEDDKTLYEQEERRLFYVAMTRARDSLTIYAKGGTGKTDPTPAGYLRGLLKDPTLHRYLHQRSPRGFQTDIFAHASPSPVGVAAWVGLSPASDLSARLSASAVQTYETCPLQFKLDREWRIPGDAPAAMQYGGTMHRVLRAYYDAVRQGRPMTEQSLLDLFRTDLADAKIQDAYQHDLYLQQGIEQLKEFLTVCRRGEMPEVLHTEEFFDVKVGATTVVGRIDRVDKLPDGRVVITDYKTGKPLSQEDADASLQLSIYAMAAREKWGYSADHLAFYNLSENTSVLTHRSETQLQEAKAKVEDVAQNITEGKFDAKPSFSCRFCAYRVLCPATEKRLSGSSQKSSH
ncbi:MAG TPA: ATP-dependent DNA helicase [Terriglobales bacterium]|jgi:DNA helicase-2/ATP-dependent DNA helicase PcrA|nr:ATP-dependent DNA helicase [Terriglobales bacterium]